MKEAFQLFWTYKQPWYATQHLTKWIKLRPALETGAVQEIGADAAEPSRRHPPVDQDPSLKRAVEGRNNKIKSISHRSFGLTAENFIAAIYHCSAQLPLPVER